MSDELKIAQANAAAEVAKASAKALGVAEGAGRFFSQILGPSLQHLGGGFSDSAAVWRYENALRLSDKVEALHKQRGLTGNVRPIPPRLAIPLIQAATAEDSDGLQQLWAGLIANATDPGRLITARRDFVALLGALEPLDARCLLEIHANEEVTVGLIAVQASDLPPELNERPKRNVSWLVDRLSVDPQLVRISLEGLARNSLVVDRMEDPDDAAAGQSVVPVTHKEADLWLSYTAVALLAACSHR